MNTATLVRTPASPIELGLRALLQRLLQRGVAAPAAPTSRPLHRGETAWITRPHGRTVTCERGTLWLTFDNEPLDLILEAGQSYCCAHASKLGIHALAEARVTVA